MAEQKDGRKNHSLKEFGGVNTQAARQSIQDTEFSWLEDVMPIGYGNMPVMPGPSAAVATLPNGDTCYYMEAANIAIAGTPTELMFMFCNSGTAYQVNLSTYAVTQIGATAQFSGANNRIAQWKNERIVIIDPTKGYFDWNGTTLTAYAGTVFSVAVANGGTGFTNATTTTITPSGGSPTVAATFSCYIGVLSATIAGGSGGTLYSVSDVLTVTGGTVINNQSATITVTSVNAPATGVITGFNITLPGVYTVAPSPLTVNTTVAHGTGSGASFVVTFGIVSATVVTPGSGYATAPTSLAIAGAGAGTGASLTAALSSSANGTCIATYAGRVWIANGRTIIYSAPNSYQDFTTASLGGSFIMTDSTLRSQIFRLLSANNYLYVWGIDSINAISGVGIQPSTATTAATTIFTNSNLTPTIGTDMPDSMLSNSRTIMFANDYGVYGLNGVIAEKMSDALDGMFPDINLANNISCGIAIIYNVQCQCFLVTFNDPVLGVARQLLMVYFNKKWVFSTQVAGMTFVTTAIYLGTPTLFGTDGAKLYRCFDQVTLPHAHQIQTKLWDFGSSLITKQAFKFALESISPTLNAVITVNLDTEIKTQSYSLTAGNSLTWYNNTNQVIAWTNNSSLTIVWLASGYNMNRTDVSNTGNYLGLTITSNSNELTYAGFHLQYEARTPWTGAPF